MPTRTSKVRNAAPPVTKICARCKQTRTLTDFYSNRDWVDQLGKDIWCKECVSKCANKDELREYFWENNREWSEKLWTSSRKKAELAANKNKTYQKAFPETQKNILDRLTCQNVIKSMQINYKFVDHTNDINVQTYEDAKEAGHIVEEKPETKDPNVKTYNAFFNGDFKPSELEYLEDYYNQLQNDFDLSDVALRDNAKKLAKAALTADKVQNDYMAGRCSLQDVVNAMQQYNSLMSMGNFAASKRKPGDKSGLGSWAEIAFYLESNGHTMQRKIEWEKDDVDKTIEEFRYIVEALDLNGV